MLKLKLISSNSFFHCRYLYTDNVDLDMDNVAAILHVSDKYLVHSLTEKCLAYIERHLTSENVCCLMEQVHEYHNDKLSEECIRLQLESSGEILKSEGFTQLCKDCVKMLVSSDDLPVDEEDVYAAVMRWAQSECQRQELQVTDTNCRVVLNEILFEIRFPVMTADFFCHTVFNATILSNDELVEIHRYIHSNHQTKLGQFKRRKRVAYRKGKYDIVLRSQTGRSVFSMHSPIPGGLFGTSVLPINATSATEAKSDVRPNMVCQDFRSSSRVYLHGITIVRGIQKVHVKVHHGDGSCVYSGLHGTDALTGAVVFRRILTIDPEVNYCTSIDDCGTLTGSSLLASYSNTTKFRDITISYRLSGETYDDASSKGYLSGMLLSRSA